MSLQNTNLIIQGAPLPAAFKGKPNDLFVAMLERMKIVSPFGTSFFVISDVMPSSNQGPWLKGGTQWWVFDPNLKTYVPLDISESETKWYQEGATTPTTTNPPLWLKTAENATEAKPSFGNPIAWYLFNGSAWVQLPVLIENRSIVQAKLDYKANFYGTASGTNNYSLSFDPNTAFDYGNGVTEAFAGYVKFTNANTGAVTLSLNGGGGAPVKKDVNQDLTAGEIAAGQILLLVFDGTNFQVMSGLTSTEVIPGPIGGVGISFGLVITNDSFVPDEQLVITADAVVMQNPSGGNFQSNSVNVTLDITTTGNGGLDTGSATADTWYYVWLISNGTDTNGVFSLSSTTPTLPSGYTFKALLGAIRTDSTIDLFKIWQTEKRTHILTTTIAKGPDGFQDFSTIVPPIAKTVFGSSSPSGGPNASGVLTIAGDANLVGGVSSFLQIVAAADTAWAGYFEAPLITPQQVYATVTGTVGVDFNIAGFTL